MKIGSIVETVASFKELRRIWNLDYPDKGDVLTVKSIEMHRDAECRAKGIVLLQFEELNNPFGICDKTVFGKDNFRELHLPETVKEILELEVDVCKQ